MKIRIAVAAAALVVLVPGLASAQTTLYKLIDKNGKVTYVDTPPKNFDGQVIPVDVDTKRNSATISTPGMPQGVKALEAKQAAEERSRERLRAAQDKLEAAKRALADARENPREGEVNRVGNAGGGTRPVPTEAYEKRIANLEEAVKVAEAELKQAQQAR
jgi:hypothetical protein